MTRLLVICGQKIDMYEGRKVFHHEWAQAMADAGRRFNIKSAEILF